MINLFIVKINYKNLTGFLIIKELNRRQVRWVEELVEYHFEIEYMKGTDNAWVDVLSRKAELQGDEKVTEAIFKIDSNSRIYYNYPQLVAVYKVLKAE